MNMNAIVMTTNVWRRARSAISPVGIAINPATMPATGTSANTGQPAATPRWMASRESAHAPQATHTAGPGPMYPDEPENMFQADAATMKISVNTAIEVVVGFENTS